MLFSCCSYKPTVPQFDVNGGFMLETSNEADFRHPLSGATHGTGGEWSSSLMVCVLNTFLVAVEKLYAFLSPGNHVDGRSSHLDKQPGQTSEPSQCHVLWNHMMASCIHGQHWFHTVLLFCPGWQLPASFIFEPTQANSSSFWWPASVSLFSWFSPDTD